MSKLLDNGTLKEVRMIVDRFLSEARSEEKAMNKLKRAQFVPAQRNPGAFISSGTAVEVAEEKASTFHALQKEISGIAGERIDMARSLGDVAELDAFLAKNFAEPYTQAKGKLSPMILAMKILSNIEKPKKKSDG